MPSMKEIEKIRNITTQAFRLSRIYPKSKIKDPLELYQALKKLETKARNNTIHECNIGPVKDRDWPKHTLEKVKELLGEGPEIFINHDGRGYALKIEEETAKNLEIHRDMGGYGILIPW